jgi:3-methylcrotonyl-CoA carboxylase beta subunit
MPVLKTAIDQRSPEFAQNSLAMRGLLDDFRTRVDEVVLGGSEASREKHLARGKLLARQRIDLLIDPGTPFLELSTLAAYGLYGGEVPSASIVTGIGRVSGRECVIVANDATVKGGTYYPMTVKKHLRAQDIARENRLPVSTWSTAAAPSCRKQDEVFPDRDHFGRIFYNQASSRRSRHPAIACRHGLLHRRRGLCAGHVRREHHRAQPGHDLSRRPAAGEGGHGRGGQRRGPRRCRRAQPPVRRHRPLRQNDAHALGIAAPPDRRQPQPAASDPHAGWLRRARRCSRPRTCTASSRRHPQAIRRARSHRPHRRRFASSTSSRRSTARRWSVASPISSAMPVGIIANNGILFSESALKGAHFIELCCQRGIPWCSCRTSPASWSAASTRTAASPRTAPSWSRPWPRPQVPKFTVIIGGSFGAGNYGMCGRAYSPRFLWMWPNARISVMGGEQAASVLATVRRDGIEAKGGQWSDGGRRGLQGADPRAVRDCRAIPTTPPARLWDDGVIDPADTRRVLGLALAAGENAPVEATSFGVFRM